MPDIPSIATLLRARTPGHSLPGGLYTRDDVFAADIDIFFHRHWIFVGLECDVPEPGDVCGVDIGSTGIVLVRDEDGSVRAYYNVCRHRGARLVPSGRGIVGKLVCPYHQWTYELDGTLVLAPHMGQDFDHACHGLRPVALRSIGGLLYACLSDDPPSDIDDLAATMEPRLAPYGLRDARIAFEADIIENGNWKLVIENNRECYHCGSNHPELCASFIDLDFGFDPATLSDEDRAAAAAHDARYAARVAEWEKAGYPSHAVEHLAGHATNFRTQRLMMSGAGESQTPDTRAACRRLMGDMTRKDLGDVHLWGHNCWHHFMGDHALSFMMIPLAADRTLVRTKWLVHKDAVEGVDYDLDTLTAVWTATNAQDAELVALAHAGAGNAGYTPGPYSRFTERQLDNFMTWYAERMALHGY
ncbi:aromatic ring-hydroxylating oxygenase subunit alpha [Gluconacetobacter tumulisoli]|uniref:Aromatic ring-hydroxylating dioxygenase subunit alpha n=1 Tax=Gluconacetobacter tumulisoli TaxID=1286189 RepID=A0A7W4K8J6_9PROT|nr:aromatic ring-hydroxylating dioxygenase subunit alpha [Gluconacetobacter tumulisoli]MBB2202354.1 aromatic ring-hydroxylating dioxygenase subunit alpha [Gluconacetobacter tumulisoli]